MIISDSNMAKNKTRRKEKKIKIKKAANSIVIQSSHQGGPQGDSSGHPRRHQHETPPSGQNPHQFPRKHTGRNRLHVSV